MSPGIYFLYKTMSLFNASWIFLGFCRVRYSDPFPMGKSYFFPNFQHKFPIQWAFSNTLRDKTFEVSRTIFSAGERQIVGALDDTFLRLQFEESHFKMDECLNSSVKILPDCF